MRTALIPGRKESLNELREERAAEAKQRRQREAALAMRSRRKNVMVDGELGAGLSVMGMPLF